MTGYVHHMLDKGQTFAQFALTCSRAFGALILMRDESMDAPIPERFEPSDSHQKEAARAEGELEKFSAMSGGERREWAMRNIREQLEYWKECEKEAQDRAAKIRSMLADVRAWQSPSDNHDSLKRFMIEQLESSLPGDFYAEEIKKWKNLDPSAHAEAHLTRLREKIAYHHQEYAEEIERTEQRNRWLAQLRRSLKGPSVAVPG